MEGRLEKVYSAGVSGFAFLTSLNCTSFSEISPSSGNAWQAELMTIESGLLNILSSTLFLLAISEETPTRKNPFNIIRWGTAGLVRTPINKTITRTIAIASPVQCKRKLSTFSIVSTKVDNAPAVRSAACAYGIVVSPRCQTCTKLIERRIPSHQCQNALAAMCRSARFAGIQRRYCTWTAEDRWQAELLVGREVLWCIHAAPLWPDSRTRECSRSILWLHSAFGPNLSRLTAGYVSITSEIEEWKYTNL